MLEDVLAEVLLAELRQVQPQLLDLLAAARKQRLVAARQLLQCVHVTGLQRLGLQLAQFQPIRLGSQRRQDLLAGVSGAQLDEDVVHFRSLARM